MKTIADTSLLKPTKDAFYLGAVSTVNAGNGQYVAYVFAADTAGKVKCGTYTGDGGASNPESVGFIPGFVLIKRSDGTDNWFATTTHTQDDYKYWYPNTTSSLDGNSANYIELSNYDGGAFICRNVANGGSEKHIYLAVAKDLTGPSSTQLNLLGNQDLEYFSDGTEITSNASASGSNISFASETFAGDDAILKACQSVCQWSVFL